MDYLLILIQNISPNKFSIAIGLFLICIFSFEKKIKISDIRTIVMFVYFLDIIIVLFIVTGPVILISPFFYTKIIILLLIFLFHRKSYEKENKINE